MSKVKQIEGSDMMIKVLQYQEVYRENIQISYSERRLLMAILDRAIRDAFLPPNYVQKIPNYVTPARDWLGLDEPFLVDSNPPEWSFDWVCDWLQINPVRLRIRLQSIIKSGQSDYYRTKILGTSFRKVVNGFNFRIRSKRLEKLVA